jgi:hypothetical protein
VKVASEGEFNAAFARIVQARADALLVRGGAVFLTRRRQLVALAARHALPTIYVSREYVELGGLMSYGPSLSDACRRAGIYVGRILKGTKPASGNGWSFAREQHGTITGRNGTSSGKARPALGPAFPRPGGLGRDGAGGCKRAYECRKRQYVPRPPTAMSPFSHH